MCVYIYIYIYSHIWWMNALTSSVLFAAHPFCSIRIVVFWERTAPGWAAPPQAPCGHRHPSMCHAPGLGLHTSCLGKKSKTWSKPFKNLQFSKKTHAYFIQIVLHYWIFRLDNALLLALFLWFWPPNSPNKEVFGADSLQCDIASRGQPHEHVNQRIGSPKQSKNQRFSTLSAGKRWHDCGTSPFWMGKLTISMAHVP